MDCHGNLGRRLDLFFLLVAIGFMYFYVYAPNGQKFRSNVEIKKYLGNHPDVKCDFEATKISKTFPTEKPKTKG